jgi:hypothetical protein
MLLVIANFVTQIGLPSSGDDITHLNDKGLDLQAEKNQHQQMVFCVILTHSGCSIGEWPDTTTCTRKHA